MYLQIGFIRQVCSYCLISAVTTFLLLFVAIYRRRFCPCICLIFKCRLSRRRREGSRRNASGVYRRTAGDLKVPVSSACRCRISALSITCTCSHWRRASRSIRSRIAYVFARFSTRIRAVNDGIASINDRTPQRLAGVVPSRNMDRDGYADDCQREHAVRRKCDLSTPGCSSSVFRRVRHCPIDWPAWNPLVSWA